MNLSGIEPSRSLLVTASKAGQNDCETTFQRARSWPLLFNIYTYDLPSMSTNRAIHDPDHVLHGQLVGQQEAHLGRLRSRRPFVPAAWKLLGSLYKLDIRVKQWTKHKWNADHLESTSRVHAFIPRVSSRPLGMSLPKTSWVRLNRLRTGVGRFHSSMYKWGLAPSPNCACGTTKQTADHVISLCLLHHVPIGTRVLQVLNDTARCWLNTTTASI